MSFDLQIEKMTFAEKMEAMELLWSELSRRPEQLPSPTSHKEILDQRRGLVATGKLKFLNWDTAIADLRKELNDVRKRL